MASLVVWVTIGGAFVRLICLPNAEPIDNVHVTR